MIRGRRVVEFGSGFVLVGVALVVSVLAVFSKSRSNDSLTGVVGCTE